MDVLLSINENGLLGNAEFDDAAGLEIDDDFEDIADYLRKTEVVIPDNVIYIDDRAFYDKRWLTGITISDRVVSIGNAAFADCNYLTMVTMTDNVTFIGT